MRQRRRRARTDIPDRRICIALYAMSGFVGSE
jgi:hypothetical protein